MKPVFSVGAAWEAAGKKKKIQELIEKFAKGPAAQLATLSRLLIPPLFLSTLLKMKGVKMFVSLTEAESRGQTCCFPVESSG